MEALLQDLSYGLRQLGKHPGFALIAVISLALGIGANSVIFSVTNGLLLRPLPYKDAERLVILWNRSPGLNVEKDWFSLGQYLDIKTENHVFEETAAVIGASFNLTGRGQPEHLDGARVSSSLFSLLSVQAAHGRVFSPEDEEKGRDQTVILSHAFWQRRFGSDPAVVGRQMTLNDQNFTIVGVLPAEFSLHKEVLPTVNGIQRADVLLPLPITAASRSNRGGEDYNILARLKPQVTVALAQADMDVIAAEMKRQYPQYYPANGGLTLSVLPLLEQVVGEVRRSLYILVAAVGFVLLIACANVANLLLARAAARQKEIAVRLAVGAGRWRIVRQLLTESTVLSLAGGLVGLGIALAATRALRVSGTAELPRLSEIGVDGRVLGFTFLVSLLTGIVFGLAPAIRASRVDLNESLKDGGRSLAGIRHQRTRNSLVVAAVALALVLLIGAGLLIRSYQRILNASPGFDPRGVLSLRLSLPASRYATPEATMAFYRKLEERVRQLPGVEAVGTNLVLPLSHNTAAWGPINVEGYVPRASSELIIANERFISPDYLRTMGIPLVKGRAFDERDIPGAPDVTIINEQFARRFWPNEDPLGKRIQRNGKGPWRIIVGVVRDDKEVSLEDEPLLALFHPVEQFSIRSRYLVARTTADPGRTAVAVVREIQSLDVELPVYDSVTMEQRLHEALARRRFAMGLLGMFAAVALALAMIGIYGVMGYWVSQRKSEIGIRAALGADPRTILRLVFRQALVLILAGIAIGLAGAFVLTRLMSGLLYGVSATDPGTFVLLPLLLGATALLASLLPARRAARIDPLIALRHE